MPSDRPIRATLSTDVWHGHRDIRRRPTIDDVRVGIEGLFEAEKGEEFRPTVHTRNKCQITCGRFRGGNLQESLFELFAQGQFSVE